MNRTALVVVLVAFALAAAPLLAGLTVAQGPGGQGGHGGHGQGQGGMDNRTKGNHSKMMGFHGMRDQADKDARALQNLTPEKQRQGFEKAERSNLFSRFNESNGTVTGRFVTFGHPSVGHLTNFQVNDSGQSVPLFQNVRVEGLGNAQARITGSVWRELGPNAGLAVHNNPTAQIHLNGDQNFTGRLTLEVAGNEVSLPAANATQVRDNGYTVTLANAHFHVVPHGNATLEATGRTIIVTLRGGDGVSVGYHPRSAKLFADTLHDLNKAVARGKAGAVATVVNVDGTPLQDVQSYGVEVSTRAIQNNGASFVVSSDNPSGKVVVLNLDTSVVNVTNVTNLRIRLDGMDVPQLPASAPKPFEAIINATTAQAKAVTVPGQGTQIWVYVPSFSDHTLTVQSTEGTTGGPNNGGNNTGGNETGGSGMPGFEAVFVILAAAAAVLAVKKRRA
ncbi:MAG TPA: hypothetical protein VNZ52_15115 [Candidatus Thermoplasmatota archaeon]|nr:hypothetical protein [Candidatus Thermoplasmatota archaeon]